MDLEQLTSTGNTILGDASTTVRSNRGWEGDNNDSGRTVLISIDTIILHTMLYLEQVAATVASAIPVDPEVSSIINKPTVKER